MKVASALDGSTLPVMRLLMSKAQVNFPIVNFLILDIGVLVLWMKVASALDGSTLPVMRLLMSKAQVNFPIMNFLILDIDLIFHL